MLKIGDVLRANETLKNSYDQVLFVGGREYKISDVSKRCYYVPNELRSESPIRMSDVGHGKKFEALRRCDDEAF